MEAAIASQLAPLKIGTVLDYGCGNMPYRPLFERISLRYVGCDLPGNELADIGMDELGSIPVDDNYADMVLSTQVLEHVLDPLRYLAECHRVLRDDGRLLLTTHGVWRYHPDPRDMWRWTSDGLRKIVEDQGFSILHFQGIMGPASTALQLWQDAVHLKVHWRLRKFFIGLMQAWIRSADLRCLPHERDREACVYLVIAKKNQRNYEYIT